MDGYADGEPARIPQIYLEYIDINPAGPVIYDQGEDSGNPDQNDDDNEFPEELVTDEGNSNEPDWETLENENAEMPEQSAEESEAVEQAVDEPEPSENSDNAVVEENLNERDAVDADNEPPAKKMKVYEDSDDEDGTTCSICLDAWSNVGEHRLVSLKCGHLFGLICIRKWFHSQRTYEKSCPTCKRRSSIKDFRFIYARKLVAMDTTELIACKKQLTLAKEEKNRMEELLQKTIMNQKYQIEELRATIKGMSNRGPTERNYTKTNFKAKNPNKQIKVMFRTKDHLTMDPTAIFRRMQRYNPNLKIENWKIVHRRIEEGGQRLIIYIDRQSGEAIKKAGYGAYTGVDRGFFRFLNE